MGLKPVAMIGVCSSGKSSKVKSQNGVRKARPSEAESLSEAIKRSKEYELVAGVY